MKQLLGDMAVVCLAIGLVEIVAAIIRSAARRLFFSRRRRHYGLEFEFAFRALNEDIPVRRADWPDGVTLQTLHSAEDRGGEPINGLTALVLVEGEFPTLYTITAEDRAATDWEIAR